MSEDERYQELARALRGIAAEVETASRQVGELGAVVTTLIDILVAKEQLSVNHRRLLGKLKARSSGEVRLRPFIDKHSVANADIDCASCLDLCHARCCSFSVVLTEQDLGDGEVRWELDQPYMLRHEADGFCAHLDRAAGGGCTIYAARPAACREFDCRQDRRVWVDFAAREAAPMPVGLVPLDED